MRICVLSDKYPPDNGGGAGVVAANLASGYATRGHDVTVVTAVEDPDRAGVREQSGVTVHAIHVPTVDPLRPYYSIYHPVAVRRVAAVLDARDFDVVHAHNLHQYLSYHTITLAKRRGLPVVLTLHDAMSVEYGKLVPDERYLEKQPVEASSDSERSGITGPPAAAYRIDPWEQLKRRKVFYFPLRNRLNRLYINDRVDVTVAVSDALRSGLSINGIRPDCVIHNGIEASRYVGNDSERFRTTAGLADEEILLFTSRPEYYKGGEHLARAFRRIAANRTDVVLAVTGSETESLTRMRELAGPYSERVVATGWLDEETIRAAYEAATVVVTPSLYLDPFPTVNLEAMAAETPVVATCFGGSREVVVDGETGVLTNPMAVERLATTIAQLLDSPELCQRYGTNGRARIEDEFTLDDQVSQYLALLKR